jgi:Tfp pilus assembly protein PilV
MKSILSCNRLPEVARKAIPAPRRGAALIIALTTLLVVMLMTGAIVQALTADLRQSRSAAMELQAQWLADAAADRAHAQLRANPAYEGETWQASITDTANADTNDMGVAEIRVRKPAATAGAATVTIEARYPDHPWRRALVSRTCVINSTQKPPQPGPAPEETAP